MLDEKDLQAIQSMMDKQKAEILEQSAANMRVILESAIGPQVQLLFEKLDTMEEKMIPREAIEDHDDRLDILEAMVRQHSREIEKLKKAQ